MHAGIRGRGDYVLGPGFKGPTAFGSGGTTYTTPAAFGGGPGGDVHIAHREYIGQVATDGVAFATQYTLPINPGMAQTFPWLSQFAASYEEYEFVGLVFEFISTSSNALDSQNTALGSVMMATQYNANNPPFTSMQTMLQYDKVLSTKPSNSAIHAVECAPRRTVLPEMYVRTQDVPGQDKRLYDLGVFQICTVGQQTGCEIGQLWVNYQVKLRKPKLGGFLGGTLQQALWSVRAATAVKAIAYTYTGTNRSGLLGDVAMDQDEWAKIKVFDQIGLTCGNGQVSPGQAGDIVTYVTFPPSTFGKCFRVSISAIYGQAAKFPFLRPQTDSVGIRMINYFGSTGANTFVPLADGLVVAGGLDPAYQGADQSWWADNAGTASRWGGGYGYFIVDGTRGGTGQSFATLALAVTPSTDNPVNAQGVNQFDLLIQQVPNDMFGKNPTFVGI